MAGQCRKAPASLEAQRLDRYEWVEHLGGCGKRQGRSCPGSVPSEGGCFAEETGGKTCPSASRLKNKIEQTLFGVSRHATISILEPREGTVFAARRSEMEGTGNWAQLRLRVKGGTTPCFFRDRSHTPISGRLTTECGAFFWKTWSGRWGAEATTTRGKRGGTRMQQP